MSVPPMHSSRLDSRARSVSRPLGQAKGRSRHMDEWDVGAVVEWFHAVGYTQYDESIKEHQVIYDGSHGSDYRVFTRKETADVGRCQYYVRLLMLSSVRCHIHYVVRCLSAPCRSAQCVATAVAPTLRQPTNLSAPCARNYEPCYAYAGDMGLAVLQKRHHALDRQQSRAYIPLRQVTTHNNAPTRCASSTTSPQHAHGYFSNYPFS